MYYSNDLNNSRRVLSYNNNDIVLDNNNDVCLVKIGWYGLKVFNVSKNDDFRNELTDSYMCALKDFEDIKRWGEVLGPRLYNLGVLIAHDADIIKQVKQFLNAKRFYLNLAIAKLDTSMSVDSKFVLYQNGLPLYNILDIVHRFNQLVKTNENDKNNVHVVISKWVNDKINTYLNSLGRTQYTKFTTHVREDLYGDVILVKWVESEDRFVVYNLTKDCYINDYLDWYDVTYFERERRLEVLNKLYPIILIEDLDAFIKSVLREYKGVVI